VPHRGAVRRGVHPRRAGLSHDGAGHALHVCDTEGDPVRPQEAKAIIAERFTVGEEIRARRRSKKKRAGKAPQNLLAGPSKLSAQGASQRATLPTDHPPGIRGRRSRRRPEPSVRHSGPPVGGPLRRDPRPASWVAVGNPLDRRSPIGAQVWSVPPVGAGPDLRKVVRLASRVALRRRQTGTSRRQEPPAS
jgi:hypothetical protein